MQAQNELTWTGVPNLTEDIFKNLCVYTIPETLIKMN